MVGVEVLRCRGVMTRSSVQVRVGSRMKRVARPVAEKGFANTAVVVGWKPRELDGDECQCRAEVVLLPCTDRPDTVGC